MMGDDHWLRLLELAAVRACRTADPSWVLRYLDIFLRRLQMQLNSVELESLLVQRGSETTIVAKGLWSERYRERSGLDTRGAPCSWGGQSRTRECAASQSLMRRTRTSCGEGLWCDGLETGDRKSVV